MNRKNKVLWTGALLIALAVPFASANPSPNGPGQPGVSCEVYTIGPHGFTTDGFANAELHYAGTEGSASWVHANSEHAVSQYDMACYQLTQHQQ